MTEINNPSLNIRETVLEVLQQAGPRGMTWREVKSAVGHGHETVTGNLSPMHRDGLICRLKERRGGSRIYVTPENVLGRPTEAQGWKCPDCKTVIRLHCDHCGWHRD